MNLTFKSTRSTKLKSLNFWKKECSYANSDSQVRLRKKWILLETIVTRHFVPVAFHWLTVIFFQVAEIVLTFFILADDSADCVTHQLILRVGHRSLSDPSHHSRTVRCHHGTKWPNIFPKKTNKFFRFGIDKNPHHCLAAQPKWCGSWNLFQNANFTLEVKCWACYNYLCVIYPKPFVRQLDVHLPTSWCRIRWEAAKLNIYRPV